MGGNVNNNVEETSEAPAVCEISKQYSSRRVCFKAKTYSCYTAKKDQSWRSARDVLVGIQHRRNYKASCAEAVRLFENGMKARGIVGGISETPCATQAIEALIVVLH